MSYSPRFFAIHYPCNAPRINSESYYAYSLWRPCSYSAIIVAATLYIIYREVSDEMYSKGYDPRNQRGIQEKWVCGRERTSADEIGDSGRSHFGQFFQWIEGKKWKAQDEACQNSIDKDQNDVQDRLCPASYSSRVIGMERFWVTVAVGSSSR
jgi:hypothetical protein